MRIAALCFAAMLGAVTSVCSAADTIEYPTMKGLDDIVTSAIQAKLYPGAVLIVGSPKGVYWAKAYGKTTFDTDAKPMSFETMFDLASVSKVVGTATTAMALIEEGKMSLDDKVSKYIPEFASNGKENDTVRDLLTHVSGLPAYVSATKVDAAKKPDQPKNDALIQFIANLKTSATPRTKVIYSCLNMLTLARVNETVLKGTQDEFLKKRVYGPLGMKNTTYFLTEEQKAKTAPTAKKAGGYNTGEIHDPLANYHGAGDHCPGNAGLFSTATDLAKYCQMVLNEGKAGDKSVFKPETIAAMTKVQTPKDINDVRGFGWDIYSSPTLITPMNDLDNNAIVAHTGFTGTLIWIDKYSKTYVVFLTNRVVGGEDKDISPVRREVCKTVLRGLPVYAKVFSEEKTAE